ncbi:MAG: DUF4437 domain-containing protein [Hyphomicrobiaceae bacterium]
MQLCGDASPKAGVFFGGDNKKGVTSGVLLKFSNGFSSPPHIYNISSRAVVISGTVHNGTPNAKTMWMGLASYWTQLASEMHIMSPFIGSELVLSGRTLHLLAGSIASDQR